MTCIAIPGFGGGAVLCVGETYRIRVNGKVYDVEWHSYAGPIVLTKRGDMAARQPGPVLTAMTLWNLQGRQVDDEGLCCCLWEEGKELENGYAPAGYTLEIREGLTFVVPTRQGAP